MKDDAKYLLVSQILNNIPKNVKPIPFLSNLLCISNESVYRRIRGEIPFTFDEIIKLSQELNFSIDEVIGKKRVSFNLSNKEFHEPEDIFASILENYAQFTLKFTKEENKSGIIVMNHFILFETIGYENLFKFIYYKFLHRSSQKSFNYSFSDVIINENILSHYSKIKMQSKHMSNIAYVIDRNIFTNTIKEIQYYYKRKLLTDQELHSLKNDLIRYITHLEACIRDGKTNSGSAVYYYLSSINLTSNSALYHYGNEYESNFWIYPLYLLRMNDLSLCTEHKKWLEASKRYSTLITQSNEILQAEFLNKQYENIENITNVIQYSMT